MNPSRGLSSAPATPLLLGDTRAMLVYPCSGTKAHQPPTASAAATAPWEGGVPSGVRHMPRTDFPLDIIALGGEGAWRQFPVFWPLQ